MKQRIVECKDWNGRIYYRMQFKTWYFPFWRYIKRDNGYGGEYIVERDTPEELVQFLKLKHIKERDKKRVTTGVYDDNL
ncbi:hypothetical protein VPFG_00298 [Vibrio phage nt-1]|uniref:Uncharacterized protein n=1 Tax=Vibrio phage nt-1 TaxID=115992 RepID=R9TJL8_9CAUD|nr:hypothetical protein VPFG_00298 [Vibrio phage nt-1]AGN30297.2 hypothetical protein VPFG_00298 [Vibrio phage nt-1]